MPPSIPTSVFFPSDTVRWLPDRDCLSFLGVDGQKVFTCLLSWDALYSHFGVATPNAGEALHAYTQNQAVIGEAVLRKIQEGAVGPNDEIRLLASDFDDRTTTTTTTTPTPRRGSITFVESADLAADPVAASFANRVKPFLRDHVATPGIKATAYWDVLAIKGTFKLVHLTIVDAETVATVQDAFVVGGDDNFSSVRLSIYNLWDKLLQKRMQAQIDALRAHETAVT